MSKEKCTVRWFFEKQEIKETNHRKIKIEDSSAILTIVDAEHEDSGEYMVKIANSAGEVESVGILTVKGRLKVIF